MQNRTLLFLLICTVVFAFAISKANKVSGKLKGKVYRFHVLLSYLLLIFSFTGFDMLGWAVLYPKGIFENFYVPIGPLPAWFNLSAWFGNLVSNIAASILAIALARRTKRSRALLLGLIPVFYLFTLVTQAKVLYESNAPVLSAVLTAVFLSIPYGGIYLFYRKESVRRQIFMGDAKAIDIDEESDGESQRWGLVGTLLWGLAIALVFVVTQLFTFSIYIVYIAIGSGNVSTAQYQKIITDLQYNGTVFSICTLASFLTCSGMIFGIVKIKRGSSLRDYLGLKTVDLRTVKRWSLVLVAFMALSTLLATLLGRPVPEFMLSVYSSAKYPWLLWLALVVAAPIVEELFFRGFLISGLSSSVVGPIGAIVVSSLLWAAIHAQYDTYHLAQIFIFGLGLGLARVMSESVFLTLGLHSFTNLVATILTALYIA